MSTEKEKVTCQICGFESEYLISSGHLKRHDISVPDYKKKYPDAKMITDAHHDRLVRKQADIKKSDSDIIIEYEKSLDDIETSPEAVVVPQREELDLFSKIDELRKDFTAPTNYFTDPLNLIPPDKLHILNYLVNIFPKNKIENNFYVEKKFLNGSIDYRFITDIAIPSLLLDIEFNKAFWHNYDRPKEIRDYVLKNDGWIIIDINEKVPSIAALDEALKPFLKKKKIK